MGRGPKKHLKRLNAPKHWMLDKLAGKWAPKPSAGPHKTRESLPLVLMLRNRLKYALTRRETVLIAMQRLVKVDGKVRTDINFPAGFMDVVTIDKTNERFRLLFDVKGRFATHRISQSEARFKLAKVKKVQVGAKGIPFLVTHDGRTFRYPDPSIKEHDTVKIDLVHNKIVDRIQFETGNKVMITGGKNLGRVGILESVDKHPGSFNVAHIKDATGHTFATREAFVFTLGKGNTSLVTLPKRQGIKSTIIEERDRRLARESKTKV